AALPARRRDLRERIRSRARPLEDPWADGDDDLLCRARTRAHLVPVGAAERSFPSRRAEPAGRPAPRPPVQSLALRASDYRRAPAGAGLRSGGRATVTTGSGAWQPGTWSPGTSSPARGTRS